jgi:hypothetical protein
MKRALVPWVLAFLLATVCALGIVFASAASI